MKQLYIVLAHTGTLLSKLIKIKTGAEYTHSSLALEYTLKPMYSFGRKKPYNPFIGGFVKEGADFGTFKRFYNTEISVFEIDVTDEQYEKAQGLIEYISKHRQEYKFNVKGLFLAGFNRKTNSEKTYYCAEFVKYILENSGVDISNLPDVIKPEHFKNINNAKLIYKGLLRKYRANIVFEEIAHVLKRKVVVIGE